MIIKLMVLTLIALLIGCASLSPPPRPLYHPRLSMTHDEWLKHFNQSDAIWQPGLTPKIVSAEEDTEVWTLGDGLLLYFQDGRLIKMDQGQLMQQRTQIEIIDK